MLTLSSNIPLSLRICPLMLGVSVENVLHNSHFPPSALPYRHCRCRWAVQDEESRTNHEAPYKTVFYSSVASYSPLIWAKFCNSVYSLLYVIQYIGESTVAVEKDCLNILIYVRIYTLSSPDHETVDCSIPCVCLYVRGPRQGPKGSADFVHTKR
jgi:hypothetical protein